MRDTRTAISLKSHIKRHQSLVNHIYLIVSVRAYLKDPRAAKHRGPDRRGAVGHVRANRLDEVEVQLNVLQRQSGDRLGVVAGAHDQPSQQAIQME